MREILFRGKRFDNGEWIEGNYRAVRNSHFSYIECIDKPTDCYRIDPETVGQFTGFTDINGKKIFEGDVVLCFGGESYMGFHEFQETIIVDEINNYDTILILSNSENAIRGNIYDNPELVKEQGYEQIAPF